MKTLSRTSKTLCMVIALLCVYTTNATIPHAFAWPVPTPDKVLYNLGKASSQSLPKRMNILVWNLHKGANETFASDFNELSYQKDILVNQEMQLDLHMGAIFASLPLMQYSTATSFYLGKDLLRTGVSTASTVMPSKIGFVRTTTLEPVINSPKVTLITQYPIRLSTKQLTVVNIHGINFVDGPSFRKEINNIYEAIKEMPSPLIFTGDFNSWNDDRNAILKEMADKLHLKEAHFFPDNRMTFNKHPLDHFYYTEDIKIIEAKVEGFYQGSDHKPLELVIEYSPML